MSWLKESWFKISIVLLLIATLYLSYLLWSQHEDAVAKRYCYGLVNEETSGDRGFNFSNLFNACLRTLRD
ncbi:MAG: hypothetical protein A2831_02495 [Candidatus Yanofskybacteria bacterium RIFCSPHIGHO2_01_FULL_44_17]|uniref:Uncharacterized protein n=1 Tax=Candidatus Yanofskybacteria bacterium RIFCSPHIGHO2_01_FULL_44_17 TaxID=1802668 RepID=A0A1F8EZM8_9BACT|nr:MAG: hypothetical protein A2831_02495 [Candidatus Yanofskybacteria bacterium RIFCSPHIGHO2_01_FULL_44_17]